MSITTKMKTADKRVFNFSAGPAAIPIEVLQKAQEEMLSVNGIGMSVMEISHRSKEFWGILNKARDGVRELLSVPDDYDVLFVQGGASMQFSMIPLNFLKKNETADYILTGWWGRKAHADAEICGSVNTIYSGAENNWTNAPREGELNFTPSAKYVHYVANETIEGVEFKYDVNAGDIPVICDMSSNIMSKPVDISNYAMIYFGAQKNIGPSGIATVIIRRDMLERVNPGLHPVMDYKQISENDSMVNTPNTWSIYFVGLVCDWLKEKGGLAAMEKINLEKAAEIYSAIDSSDGFFTGHAAREVRSNMNVSFHLPTAELDKKFVEEAEGHDLSGLAGHRVLGGVRASIYNAFPREGITALTDFMRDFAAKHG